MLHQGPRARLDERLHNLGIDLTAEEGAVVRRWLCRDQRQFRPTKWQRHLPQVVALAQRIYRAFTARYSAYYLEPAASGRAAVSRALRRRLGFVDPRMVDATLERIRNRRLHLLEAMRAKYQANLF